MNHARLLGIAATCIIFVCCTLHAAPIEKLDPNMAASEAEGDLLWYDILGLGLEGQGFTNTAHNFDRLPAKAEGVVPGPVWSLSHHSAGLYVRFVTDAPAIAARWKLRFNSLAMPHMPATGVSGLDLYARTGTTWQWIGTGRPEKFPDNQQTLASGIPEGMHEYLLYLPLYNGVDSVEIGVAKNASLAKAPAWPAAQEKPLVFYGTSIVHGGCASRPGMAYPAILGRHLQRPAINLGFSGNGKMDLEVADLLVDIDAAVYVIDCAPNMNPKMIAERTIPLVARIRKTGRTRPSCWWRTSSTRTGGFFPEGMTHTLTRT